MGEPDRSPLMSPEWMAWQGPGFRLRNAASIPVHRPQPTRMDHQWEKPKTPCQPPSRLTSHLPKTVGESACLCPGPCSSPLSPGACPHQNTHRFPCARTTGAHDPRTGQAACAWLQPSSRLEAGFSETNLFSLLPHVWPRMDSLSSRGVPAPSRAQAGLFGRLH